MMRHLFAAASLALLAGCFVSFDQNGQPCDAKKQCLKGFHCDATDHCVSGSPASSGSASSGSGSGSSGTTTGGSTTGSSTSTGSSTGTTGAQGCATKICPAAQACALISNTPTCVARGAGTCDAATPCSNVGEVCVTPGGGATGGICILPCTLGSNTCPSGETCTALTGERGDTFPACVPQPAPQACSRSTQCGPGQACVPFDVSSLGSGGTGTVVNDLPVLFCDLPIAGGLGPGGTCTKSSDCASGLCIDTGGGTGSCQTPCEQTADCSSGQTCAPTAEVGLARRAMACVTGATGCTACTACGADAPTCDAALNLCTLPCDTEDIDPCGHSGSCVGSGTSTYCAVSGAACP